MNLCHFCSRQMKRAISLRFIFSFQKVVEHAICETCKNKFKPIDPTQVCPGCSREQLEGKICVDCEKWQARYPKLKLNHSALFQYNEIAREFMNNYKFKGDIKLAEVFGQPLHQALAPYVKSHLITAIPASQSSYEKRGFHAVELLLDYAQIPHVPVLEHRFDTGLQSSKNREERLKSAQPFVLKEEEYLINQKKPLLIVDDVYTTGRTILHARNIAGNTVPTESMTLFR